MLRPGFRFLMGAIDLILNLAGLLWWLSWRSMRFDPLASGSPATLVGTLKRPQARRLKGWQIIPLLSALLVIRALVYWLLGAPADWTPKLNLEFVVLAFRSDSFPGVLVFSFLSFVRAFVVLYFWLIALTIVNRSRAEIDPVQKLVRLQLGKMARWLWPIQLLMVYLLAVALWIALEPLLVRLDITSPVRSAQHLVGQGVLVGLGLPLSLKYLFPVILCLHLVASYVYLGDSPIWDFVAGTSGNVTAPLRWLPLRYAKVDFTPLAGAVLILALLHWLPSTILSRVAAANLSPWPQ